MLTKVKKTIIYFLFENKINVFIMFILPIINAIFNGYFFSKYIGLTIKYLVENNLLEGKKAIIKIILVIILLQILRYIQRKSLSKFLSKINYKIKINTFERFTYLSVEDTRKYSENVSKLGDEIVETVNLIYSFLYRPFCSLVIGIITMIYINGLLGKIFFIFSVIFIISLKFIVKKPMESISDLEIKQNANKLFINDISRNAFIEKILNLKYFSLLLFNKKLKKENNLLIEKYDNLAVSGSYSNFLCEITCCILLLVSIFLNIPVEVKISSINLIDRFFSDFNDIPDKIIPLLNNIGKIKENMKILEAPIVKEKKTIEKSIDIIKIQNIYFAYNENKIINNLSLELKKGLYKIEGQSGSGKSTLLQLIMGLKNINSGNIFINNESIENINILNKVSYLSQFDYTYNRTVKDNLSMNKDINSIRDHIVNYNINNILDNNVGINGEKISGGQCKRLCFLRMLNFHSYGNLIILDEPFNGLDNNLIGLIIEFIKNNINSSIILIIDHTNSISSLPFSSINI